MKKSFLFLVSLFIALSFCNGESKKEISLGYVGDLSGRGSELWVNARNGLQLGIKEYNQTDGPFLFNLEVRDDQGIPELTSEYTQELIDKGVTFFLGPTTSGNASVLEEYFSREGILFLSPTVSSVKMVGKKDNLLRTSGNSNHQGAELAEAALNLEGDQSFVVLGDSSNASYSETVAAGFIHKVESSGGIILGVSYYDSSEKPDFVMLAKIVLDLEPDGLLIIGKDLDAAAIIQQVYKSNSNINFYTPSWANTTEFIMNAGKAGEGSYQLGSFDYTSQEPRYLKFRDSYRSEYNTDPLFTAARYYEAIQILIKSLEGKKHWNILEIKESILNMGITDSFIGEIEMNQYGDITRDYILVQIQDGQQWVIK